MERSSNVNFARNIIVYNAEPIGTINFLAKSTKREETQPRPRLPSKNLLEELSLSNVLTAVNGLKRYQVVIISNAPVEMGFVICVVGLIPKAIHAEVVLNNAIYFD